MDNRMKSCTCMSTQVCSYLTSKSWETRIAAGQAVEAIAKNVKRWRPDSSRQTSPSSVAEQGENEVAETSKESSPTSDKDSDLLTFATFDLNQVMPIFWCHQFCLKLMECRDSSNSNYGFRTNFVSLHTYTCSCL